jgi:hypothetical protein
VYINGARLLPTDYTATNGTTVVLGTPALLNDAVTVLNYTSSIAALPTSRDVFDYTATAAQTTFTVSGGYTVGLLDVYVNGSKLTPAEVTATNGTTFVLTVASVVGDQVQAIRYNSSINGVSGSGTANYVSKFTASGTIGNSSIQDSGSALSFGVASTFLDIVNIGTAGTERLNIFGAGSQYINIKNTTTNADMFVGMSSGLAAAYIGTGSSNPFVFVTAGTERMRINADGNISMTGTLNVQGNLMGQLTADNAPLFKVVSGASTSTRSGIAIKDSWNGSTNTGSFMYFFVGTGSGEREALRITNAGDVLMGKSAENAGVAGFQYRGAAPGLVQITRDGGESLQLWRYTSNGKMLVFYYNGAEVGSISSNTNSLPSDLNFKKDISNISIGLNLVNKLRPVHYRHKLDEDNEALSNGIIAQELEQSLLDCGIEKNTLLMLQHKPNEKENESQYWVDYTKMIPILIKSIQELSAKITILENK